MNMKHRSSIVLAVVIVLVIAYGYMQHRNAQRPETRYRFEEIIRGNVAQSVSANGTLNPVTLVNVGTQVSGTVRKLDADFNDSVRKGQVLLELDPSLLAAQAEQSTAGVKNAGAALDLAKKNEMRARSLFAQEYMSRQDLDVAIEARKTAAAQLEQARALQAKDRVNLGYTVIRSPVSGVVVNRTVDIGQTVAASFQTPTLFQIAQDLSKMQADTSFAESDIGDIRAGQKVNFSVDAFPSRLFQGTVKQIRLNPTTQQNVVTYNVVVSVDNPDQILLPGMTAYLSIVVARRQNALLVPNAALRYKPPVASQVSQAVGQGRRTGAPSGTVYVLEGREIRSVNLSTGITDGRNTEVLGGGLKPGDKVVVADLQPSGDQSTSTVRFRVF